MKKIDWTYWIDTLLWVVYVAFMLTFLGMMLYWLYPWPK
jgi:hypothetical protein